MPSGKQILKYLHFSTLHPLFLHQSKQASKADLFATVNKQLALSEHQLGYCNIFSSGLFGDLYGTTGKLKRSWKVAVLCFGAERDQNAGMTTALPSYSFDNIGTSFATFGGGSISTLAADSGRYIQDDLQSVVLPNGSSVPLSALAANTSVFLSPAMMDGGPLTGIGSGYSQSQQMPVAVGHMSDSFGGGSDSMNLGEAVAGTLNGSNSLNLGGTSAGPLGGASDSMSLGGTVSGTLTSEELTQFLQGGSVLTEMRSDEFLRQFDGIVFQQTYDAAADVPQQPPKIDPESSEH